MSRVKHRSVANTRIKSTNSIFQPERDNGFPLDVKVFTEQVINHGNCKIQSRQYRLKIKEGREGLATFIDAGSVTCY